MEGPEEEEEKVNIQISTHLSLTCSLFKQPEEKSAFQHLELNFFWFFSVINGCFLSASPAQHPSQPKPLLLLHRSSGLRNKVIVCKSKC